MGDLFVAAISCSVTVFWLPFCVKFYRNWKLRRNPISLSIFALIVFVMFSTIGEVVWLVLLKSPTVSSVILVLTLTQAIVCAFFYASFGWASDKFPDSRG